ncbi:hypothetical protein NPIL_504761 [Nephila pilipes]|uniref:Uncharacterized protein n=1 Tax=Nephila pilipes TaxID=299642 RepID=A0A8X6QNL8_NEPPI|nr:hypothetical protein NPIL_504761 [Nephila pilipes]
MNSNLGTVMLEILDYALSIPDPMQQKSVVILNLLPTHSYEITSTNIILSPKYPHSDLLNLRLPLAPCNEGNTTKRVLRDTV